MPDATPTPARPAGRTVSSDTLVVAASVLGRPLAEPWRRGVAMLIDLGVVGLLSLLSTPWLGLATGAMLMVLFGNSPAAPIAMKTVRLVCRGIGGVIVVLSVLAIGHVSPLRMRGLNLDAILVREPSAAMKETIYVAPEASSREVRGAVDRLQRQVEDLKRENREMQTASGSWVSQARAFSAALGVTFGWSGVYFTLVAGYFGGRTLGKLLLKVRVARTDGQPYTFFDAFARHGGYVAGVAMGMVGFLRMLWEPNRQAVQDRMAGTVVLRVD